MFTVPDQTGRTAVVTGANSGTGKEAAARLAAAGARVVLAVRTPAKGEAAREDILEHAPGADVVVRRLDLADLASVREFAEGHEGPLDLLLNNASVMAVPERHLTVDGFELQTASNVLGPLALTDPPAAGAARRPRSPGRDDEQHGGLDGADRHRPPRRPAALPPDARLRHDEARRPAARPAPRPRGRRAGLGPPQPRRAPRPDPDRAVREQHRARGRGPTRSLPPMARFLPMQEVDRGAEPMLVAATDPRAENGSYWGPTGWGPPGLMQVAGRPGQVRAPSRPGTPTSRPGSGARPRSSSGCRSRTEARPVRRSS